MEEKKKKEYEGVVVSDKMQKVAVVSMETLIKHPLYKKRIVRSRRFFVRDEENQCKVGDVVSFVSCKPYSKKTVFELVRVVKRGEEA